MDLQKFEAHANDIWEEFLGITKLLFWDIPVSIIQLGIYFLGILLIAGLIVGAIVFVISIIF